jgi:hypothetical protein
MMATQAPVKAIKKGTFHGIFEPKLVGCTGACNYTWDADTREYVLDPGDACTGTGCVPCPRTLPAIVRELVILEGSFPDPDVVGHVCGASPQASLESLLELYVKLFIRYRFLMKLAIGLGLLSAALLLAVIYLLVR